MAVEAEDQSMKTSNYPSKRILFTAFTGVKGGLYGII
jgi:hypothetical protein